MIIKFDHVAFSCSINDIPNVLAYMKDYHQIFRDNDVKNSTIKKQFMSNWSEKHTIIFLDNTTSLPIEITAYDSVISEKSKYDIRGMTIIANTSNIEASKKFYEAIGFKETKDNQLSLSTILDNHPLIIQLIERIYDETEYYGLDTYGYCCLAFVTNNARREREHLQTKGINTTEVITLTVNKKIMELFFAANDNGDICEFVCVIDKREGEE